MPNKYGEPMPGEPGYDNADWKLMRDTPSYQAGKEAGGPNAGGTFDPNRTAAYGNQAGYGDGSKFQADFQQFHKDLPGEIGNVWDKINGAYDPAQISLNQQAGQTGAAAQAGATAYSAGPNGAQQGQTRDMQMALIQQLQDQAAGRGPSLAQMQLQQGTDRNMSQAMALGQSQRGAGAAGMAKGIQGQQAGIAQGMAGDAAMLRLQEQMSARGMLGQQLGGVRGQDQGWAGMDMQNNQFNAGATNQGNQFNASQTNTMANANAQRAAEMAQAQAKLDLERERMRQDAAKQRSPVAAIGGAMSAFSDERLKTDIKSGDAKLFAFLDKLGAHEYKYKNPKHGDPRISPMAQELEQSEMGREFVFETDDGKAVDYGKGFGTLLASQAALHKRLKAVEGK
jgi:hypothetical protein